MLLMEEEMLKRLLGCFTVLFPGGYIRKHRARPRSPSGVGYMWIATNLERNRENAQYKKLGNAPFANTAIQIPNISRFNIKWTNEDSVGMFVQLGVGQISGGTSETFDKSTGKITDKCNSNGVTLRHAYGWWDLTDKFQFLAGKTTTPISPLLPYQMLGTRSGKPEHYRRGVRRTLFRTFCSDQGNLPFYQHHTPCRGPWWTPTAPHWVITPPISILNLYQTNTKLPRIDLGLLIYAGPVSFYPSFLYQRRTVDFLAEHMDGIDNHIDTYIGSLGVLAAFGALQFSAEGNWGRTGATPAAAWVSVRRPETQPPPSMTANLDNTTTYGWWLDGSLPRGNCDAAHSVWADEKRGGQESHAVQILVLGHQHSHSGGQRILVGPRIYVV